MQVYLYARSGHQVGLEAAKRCAAVASELKEFEPILCTSDFRAGAFAKELLGIKKYVNIDVIRNLYNIMERNDILIYNSDETNEIMKEGMNEYCSLVYNLDEMGKVFYDASLYNQNTPTNDSKAIFFGDDDYNNIFLEEIENCNSTYDMNLLMGHYFFLGNEKVFKNHFNKIIDEEEYVETVTETKYLLTGSIQTAIESLASGNSPVLFKREDKSYDEELIKQLQIPTIETKSLDETVASFETIIESYPSVKIPENTSIQKAKEEISKKVETFNSLTNG